VVWNRRKWIILFSIVPLAIYTIIVIIPLLSSFYYSFTDWNGFRQDYNWVGFDNYAKVFRDNLFIGAIKNTLIWMVAAVILPVGGGLSLALLLHEGIWGANFYKSLFYLPICLSLAVIGQVWIWIYQPNWGLIRSSRDRWCNLPAVPLPCSYSLAQPGNRRNYRIIYYQFTEKFRYCIYDDAGRSISHHRHPGNVYV